MNIQRRALTFAWLSSLLVVAILTTTIMQSNPKAYARKAGLGFITAELIKLKAHKNNPDQIPIGIAEFKHDLTNFLDIRLRCAITHSCTGEIN